MNKCFGYNCMTFSPNQPTDVPGFYDSLLKITLAPNMKGQENLWTSDMAPNAQAQQERSKMQECSSQDDVLLEGKEDGKGEGSSPILNLVISTHVTDDVAKGHCATASPPLKGDENEYANHSLERDEKQKELLESIITHSKMEVELRALILCCEENMRLKQSELQAVVAEKSDAEKRLAAVEEENDRVKDELCSLASTIIDGQCGTTTSALDGSKSQLSALESTLSQHRENNVAEKEFLKEPFKTDENQLEDIKFFRRENAKLRSLCSDLYREKAELRAVYERKLATTEEKMKIVATLASSHLIGRMGLEARLQVCETERLVLTTDNSLVKAQEEVVAFGRTMEIRNLNLEIEKLRRMVRDARHSQRVAEDEVVRLAALELESFSESCATSICTGSIVSAMAGDNGDEISDCSTK